MAGKPDISNPWAWAAFNALRGSRQVGMSVGPIPISEMSAYCEATGLTDSLHRMRLMRFVMALDKVERDNVDAQTVS